MSNRKVRCNRYGSGTDRSSLLRENKNLVHFVRANRLLFDVNDADYKNVTKRDETWKRIGTRLGVRANVAKERWNNIRDRYTRLKAEMTSKIKNGSRDVRTPLWYLWDVIDGFLSREARPDYPVTDFESPPTTDDNVSRQLDRCIAVRVKRPRNSHEAQLRLSSDGYGQDSDSNTMQSSTMQHSSTSGTDVSEERPIKRRHVRNTVDSQINSFFKSAEAWFKQHKVSSPSRHLPNDDDKVSCFLRSVAPQMRQLAPEQFRRCCIMILESIDRCASESAI